MRVGGGARAWRPRGARTRLAAAGREGAGHGEEDAALAGEHVAHGHLQERRIPSSALARAARRARGNGCPRRREARQRAHLRAGAVVGRALRHLHVGQLIAHLASAQSSGKGTRQLGFSGEAKTRQPGRCSAPRCSAAARIVLPVRRGPRSGRGARRARGERAQPKAGRRTLTARHDRRPRAAGRAAARRGANTAGDAHRAAIW